MRDKIVISSVPRAGSTYLFRSLMGLGSGGTTPRGFGYFKKEKPFTRPFVVKTHSIPEKVMQNGWKGIFLFRDPIECIISTRLKRWDKHHFNNCWIDKNPDECNIYKQDVLQYENIFDSWIQYKEHPVLYLRYETMDKYFNDIEEWVNRKIYFPTWKKRESNYNKVSENDLNDIRNTYSRFIEKVNNMPDISYNV